MMRRRTSLAILVALLLTPIAPVAADELPNQTRQVVVVTAANWRTTHATLTAYEQADNGQWTPVLATTQARLGSTGLVPAAERRQRSGKTPAGVFALPWAFGRAPNPGTHLAYVQVDRNDAWTYNPAVPSTYNLFQDASVKWRGYGPYVEHLWNYGRQYDYAVVLDFNLPKEPISVDVKGIRRASAPANTRRGGGIFLHVSKGEPTAGCVAIPRADMHRLLTWLDPEKSPVIAIGTAATLADVNARLRR